MADVVDLDQARSRLRADGVTNPILLALDALGVALAEHGHTWTDRERDLYETAVGYLSTESEADKARKYLIHSVLKTHRAEPLPTLLGVCTQVDHLCATSPVSTRMRQALLDLIDAGDTIAITVRLVGRNRHILDDELAAEMSDDVDRWHAKVAAVAAGLKAADGSEST